MSSAQSDAGPERRVGTLIKGKWTVEALLGVGGMASVYAAAHRNGQRAALKVLHSDFARDKTIGERFLREAYVSNKIGHPACVAVLDDDRTDDDAPFLVMELLEGDTVRELWKKSGRRLALDRTLEICADILDCLVACHAIGVIHRDLKPANIFVTNAGLTKVLDFGVAQMRSATSERTATGTALGTPAYMSPEQAMGLVDQLDGRADLFSVGAMIHALTTGHRINNGRTENEALVMAATTPVASVARIAPDLPVELIALIDKALAWDRRNRYGDAREMHQAVLRLLSVLRGEAPLADRAAKPTEIPLLPGEAAPARRAPRGSAAHMLAVRPDGPGVTIPVPAPAPIPPSLLPPEDDPRVEGLRDLFRRVERVLPNVRQFGWSHPATERAMLQVHEAFVEALAKDPLAIDFSIRPYSMLHRGQTVWEPVAPFDAIPYNFFACGMRAMRMDPGLTFDELKETFTLMLTDPSRDLPPEDDLAAAFWERALAHVRCEVVDAFAEGDAAEREAFYSESDQIEQMADGASSAQVSRLEARAMAVSTDARALKAGKAKGPMTLEDAVQVVLARQLELTTDQWSERYVDVLVDGYIDAAVNRDAPLVLASLRRSTADLVVAARLPVAVKLHDALVTRLRQKLEGQNLARLSSALTNAMFGAETLELCLKHLHANPEAVPVLRPILEILGPGELRRVLVGLRQDPPAPVRALLLAFVERSLQGAERDVAAAAAGLNPDLVFAMLAILARASTAEARQALTLMARSDDVSVRLEARALVGGEAAHGELTAMTSDPQPLVRMAALRALTRHQIKGAWAAISRLVRDPALHERGADERLELMRALVALAPERGEPIALELAKKGGVWSSGAREATRVAAAQALGELSRSSEVAASLRELAQARWGTSEETRDAAQAAADLIARRRLEETALRPGSQPGGRSPAGAPS